MDRYSDLRDRASDFVKEFAPGGPVLVLAPLRAAAEEVALHACGNALLGVTRLAFRDLVSELAAAELLRRELVPVGRFVREALAARVTAEARSQLTYLGPVANFPGFPRALTDTFEELRLNAADLDLLRQCGNSGPDLALLLEAYVRELSDRRLADHATRVRLAHDAVNSGTHDLCRMAVVALDLAPRTTLERTLLESVMRSPLPRLELHLGQGWRNRKPSSSLESLQRYLFSTDPVPIREEDGTVEIFSTSGEALECVEIARSINRAADRGVPFDEIAILLRSPERHQPLVVGALR
ncbi:MAG TPA: hypothetical protein VGH38_24385, partial [Bryobacteraceae bacterium]